MLDRSRDWQETDLRQLIADGVQESIGLDYKAAAGLGTQDAVKREIAKDVSAFANSAGGILLYGMTENGHVPTAIDPVNPQPFTKEWLENVIISNIQPRIGGLHINPIQLTGAAAGRFVFVVTIPQSHTAHQAADNRYYRRFNFQSVPMEHYEVQDAMNRSRTPIVDLEIGVYSAERESKVHTYRLHLCLSNTGAVTANNIKLILTVPVDVPFTFAHGWSSEKTIVISTQGGAYKAIERVRKYSDARLFPHDTQCEGYHMGNPIYLTIDQDRFQLVNRYDMRIQWTLFADDMIKREGSKRLLELIDF